MHRETVVAGGSGTAGDAQQRGEYGRTRPLPAFTVSPGDPVVRKATHRRTVERRTANPSGVGPFDTGRRTILRQAKSTSSVKANKVSPDLG